MDKQNKKTVKQYVDTESFGLIKLSIRLAIAVVGLWLIIAAVVVGVTVPVMVVKVSSDFMGTHEAQASVVTNKAVPLPDWSSRSTNRNSENANALVPRSYTNQQDRHRDFDLNGGLRGTESNIRELRRFVSALQR